MSIHAISPHTSAVSVDTPSPLSQKEIFDCFEGFSTPKKTYPVSTKRGIKKIQIPLSPSAKKPQEGLYRFKRKSDETSYIGVSSNINKRVSKHLFSFRHPEKEVGKQQLPQAVQAHAKKKNAENDFDFGVIFTKEQLPEKLRSLSMKEIEAHYIEYKKSKKVSLFNRRKGGGGGSGPKKSTTAGTKKTLDEVVEQINSSYHTPEKAYRLNRKSLRVELTPSAKGHIYIIKRTSTSEDKDHKASKVVSRYIGKTERSHPIFRLREHSSHARHPETETGQKRLYKDMRKHPEEFSVHLVDSKLCGDTDLDIFEKGLIRHYKDKKQPLYNKNSGGGGGHSE